METNTETQIPGNAVDTAIPVSAMDLAGPLIAGMPEVTKPNAETPEVKTDKPAATSFPPDEKGNQFDPFIHKADANGNPVKNKNGLYYSKFIGRAGSKRKGESAPPGAPPPPQKLPDAEIFEEAPKFVGVDDNTPKTVPPQDSPKAEQIDEATGAALLLVPTFDGLMQTAFSSEVALTEEEMKRITPFAAAYMREKGMKDIPPGIALTLIVVATYAPKFQKPTVKERIALYYLKVKNFFKK